MYLHWLKIFPLYRSVTLCHGRYQVRFFWLAMHGNKQFKCMEILRMIRKKFGMYA